MARPSILLLVLGMTATMPMFAQPTPHPEAVAHTEMAALPDAPGEMFRAPGSDSVEAADRSSSSVDPSSDAGPTVQATGQKPMASRLSKVIVPSQQAPSLSSRDKFLMGARDSVLPFSIVSWFTSAGYSHLTNGPPNYGTDKGAFGQRLGAAAIRDISEDIFSTSVLAPVFREDPRYYKMGPEHSFTRRIVYAATRPLITRTDSGRATPNLALILGNLAGAALTNAYYPPRNHGFSQTMQIFGGSMGGSAVGYGVTEFLDEALQFARIKKSE